jgi:hypothetical protein
LPGILSHKSPHTSPHKSPHMGTTPPHINWYTVVEEKNECNDARIHPYRGK